MRHFLDLHEESEMGLRRALEKATSLIDGIEADHGDLLIPGTEPWLDSMALRMFEDAILAELEGRAS